jgi:hypothetical protein
VSAALSAPPAWPSRPYLYLYLYLYGTLAVAVLGAGGPPENAGLTVSSIIGERLGNNIVGDLVLLPLATATVGWAAVAATARMRPRLATNAEAEPFTADDRVERTGSAAPARGRRRTARLVLLARWWRRPCSWLPPVGSGATLALTKTRADG